MKKNKIVGVAVALLGVITSIGVSYSLYTHAAEDGRFSIGKYTFTAGTGEIQYQFGAVVESAKNTAGTEANEVVGKVNPDYPVYKAQIPLKATYGTLTSGAVQDTVIGKLSLTLNVNDALKDAGVKLTAKVGGYEDGSYFASTPSLNTFYIGEDALVNKTITTAATTATLETAVKTSGAQYLDITLDFSAAVTADTFLAISNLASPFSFNVDWSAESADYEKYYIVGDASEWNRFDEYKMVPNVDATTWQWKYANLTGFTMAKLHNGKGFGTSIVNATTDRWIGDKEDKNFELDKSKTYQVYSSGNSSSEAQLEVHSNTVDSVTTNYISKK